MPKTEKADIKAHQKTQVRGVPASRIYFYVRDVLGDVS